MDLSVLISNLNISSNNENRIIEDPPVFYEKDLCYKKHRCNSNNEEGYEANFEQRIERCKNIIESLKLEINKNKNAHKTTNNTRISESVVKFCDNTIDRLANDEYEQNFSLKNINNKHIFYCDNDLLDYDKQLEKYQSTLNIALMEKKNSVKRQILAKFYKLRLLDIEKQCNIELLRVKQCLQYILPLEEMAKSWKRRNFEEDSYRNMELMDYRHSKTDLNIRSSIEVHQDMKTCTNKKLT